MPTRRAIPLAYMTAMLLCTFASVASAQAQAPAPAPIPEAMPFDIPYGAPIDLNTAQKAVMAAVAEAKKHNWKEAIAVVGPAGQLVAHATMDNTQYGSIEIAQAKARIAALLRVSDQTAGRRDQRWHTFHAQSALAGAWGGDRGRLSDRDGRQADRRDRRQRWNRAAGRSGGESRPGRPHPALKRAEWRGPDGFRSRSTHPTVSSV